MKRRIAVLAIVLLAAGCGVDTESTSRDVDVPPGPFQALTSPSPATVQAGAGAITVRLYFVGDAKLVPVDRRLSAEPTPSQLIGALQAGPTTAEHQDGLTSALSGSTVIRSVQLDGAVAVVELAAPIEGGGRSDEGLLYAQLVATLASRPGTTSVRFVRDGQPVAVPGGDGSLIDGPLTIVDYANLISSR